jgi:hypothetical protein
MRSLRLALALAASIAASSAVFAQHDHRYAPPRTEHGHPDFQGVWATEFLTTLERPQGVDYLVASPEQAQALAGGDTLVVKTTHLRADDPARSVIGRPLLLSRHSTLTEHFTRVSERELFASSAESVGR